MIKNSNEVVQVKQVFQTADLKSNCNIEKIEQIDDKYEIKAYYPSTNYLNLNDDVKKIVDEYIEDFKGEVELLETIEGSKYLLEINFNSYEYLDYISYVFNIFVDVGGAHPNSYIANVNYNTSTESVVNIDDFVDMNKDLLNILSNYTYNELKDNEKIISGNVPSMLIDGTAAKQENFDTFAIDKSGIVIFFEKYSVAPYVSGEFSVVVPYEELNLTL